MNINKILLASTALTSLLVTSNAFSQTTNFVGPSLSFTESFIGSSSENKAILVPEDNLLLLSNTPGKRNDFIPGADFNYGFATSNNTVVGLGVTYDFKKVKTGGLSFEDSDLTFNNELKNHYSIYVQPTYVINKDSAMFAKVGRHFAKANFSSNFDIGEDEFVTASKNVTGWGYGLGLKTFLTSSLFVQAEAGIVDYEDFNFTADEVINVSIKPRTTNATISVGYKF
jgi:opacity protein-like surface antigen